MDLLRIEGIHLTYPPRFRSAQRSAAEEDDDDRAEDVIVNGGVGRPTPALRGISLTVAAGEAVGLLGTAGSGRTTLLSVIAGVLRPDSGTVRIRGFATGLTAAGVGSFGDLDVASNIVRTLVLLGTPHRRAEELVPAVSELAGLDAALDTTLRDLPRQQVKLLAHVTALHAEPTVFLADDDLAQGPAPVRDATRRRLREYPDAAHAVVVATNKPAILREVCTRAVVLDAGTVSFDGSVDDALRALRARPPQEPDPADDAT